ncbi:MAG: TetR/AcrR family transcriptional regulator C-terminal domain-containing protein, partial [Chloroflexota bacterium]
DVLWGELELPPDDGDWKALLRSFATSLRSLAHAHPHAYPLLLSHRSWSLAMLGLSAVIVERLQQAGFAQKRAAVVLCTLMSYAMGYALMEVTTLLPGPPDPAAAAKSEFERLTEIMPRLPREAPARMVEVVSVLMDLDAEAPFTFGLDLMLAGLTPGQG